MISWGRQDSRNPDYTTATTTKKENTLTKLDFYRGEVAEFSDDSDQTVWKTQEQHPAAAPCLHHAAAISL